MGSVARIELGEDGIRRTIHFKVERLFYGLSGDMVELINYGTSCDYSFAEGKKYLVYAFFNNKHNELSTSNCSRTREFSDAATDLAYLNTLPYGNQVREILGVLAENDKRLRQISVVANNGRATYRTVTDEKGWFKLSVPKTATYHVRIFLPLYASVVGLIEELDLISGTKLTRTRYILEYNVDIASGKCAFINPPLSISYLDYQKYRGTYP